MTFNTFTTPLSHCVQWEFLCFSPFLRWMYLTHTEWEIQFWFKPEWNQGLFVISRSLSFNSGFQTTWPWRCERKEKVYGLWHIHKFYLLYVDVDQSTFKDYIVLLVLNFLKTILYSGSCVCTEIIFHFFCISPFKTFTLKVLAQLVSIYHMFKQIVLFIFILIVISEVVYI